MRIHFLGTGEAVPSKRRLNTSLLLETDERLVLIDCSGAPVQSIAKSGCDLDKLSDVVISHAHIDHIYGLPSLLHSIWLHRMKPSQAVLRAPVLRKIKFLQGGNLIRLHGLEETLNVTDQLINVLGLRSRLLPLLIENRCIKPDVTVQLDIDLGNWSLYAFRVKHGTVPAIGVYLESADGSHILFSADAIADSSIKNQITGTTSTLIHDCGGGLKGSQGHAGAEQINQLLRGTSIQKVYLTHLPDLSDQSLNEILSKVSKGFSGEVGIPEDGDVIDL